MLKSFYTLLFAVCFLQYNAQIIVTIAGNGTPGYSGDGGPATAALLNYPTGVACDHLGNTYVCDANHTVRKIAPNGIITHVATVYDPIAMACDKNNNLYVISQNYQSVMKIDPTGIMTAFAGTSQGIHSYSGDGGPATQATLDYPYGIVADTSGNVYIATNGDGRVRKVNSAGIISTICGHGNTVTNAGHLGDGGLATLADLASPRGLAIGKDNNLYIVQHFGSVRMIDAAGIIHTVAGDLLLGSGYTGDGGPATAGQFNSPMYMAFDTTGNMYITDPGNFLIRKVDTGGILSTYAGTYHAPQFWPNTWQGAYSGDGGDPLLCEFGGPWTVAVNSANELVIADYRNHAVRKITKATGINDIKQEQLFSLYPNPSSGEFNLTLTADAKMSVSNAIGQDILNQALPEGKHMIDLKDQAAGVYFVKVVVGNSMQTLKLVKQ